MSVNKPPAIDPPIDQGKLYEPKRLKLSTDVLTSSPPVGPDSGWKAFPELEMPKMFNERHIYHHLVESLQGTGEGSDLDKCDNIELDYNTSKPFRISEQFFVVGMSPA